MRIARSIILSTESRQELESIARSHQSSARAVERARIVLMAADGLQDIEIAARLNITRQTAARWRGRFLAEGMTSLYHDAPRSGAPKRLPATIATDVVTKTVSSKPEEATHWSRTTMA